jgi:hypothetical protein
MNLVFGNPKQNNEATRIENWTLALETLNGENRTYLHSSTLKTV